LRGRIEGILGLPLRLSERTKVIQQASTCRSWALLDPWIAPTISIRRLLRLRRLTARLAAPIEQDR
jgi:hypothetical protein